MAGKELETYWPSEKLKILITGASGLLASNIARQLIREGHYVVASDSNLNEHMNEVSFCNEFQLLDLKVLENCIKLTKGVDHIFNFATDMTGMDFNQSKKSINMYNFTMIDFNMIEAARINGIKRFFYASSACISDIKQTTLLSQKAEDAYVLLKLATEKVCKQYNTDFGIECRIGRFDNIPAASDQTRFIGEWVERVLRLTKSDLREPVKI